jgi:hypothetical protein
MQFPRYYTLLQKYYWRQKRSGKIMTSDTRFEDLEHRVRELANDVEGEKIITRHVLEQCRRNGAEIAAVRVELNTIGLRIDNLAGDVTEARAALNRLNIISQDVTTLRGEVIAIRRDMDTIRQDMDTMRGEAATRHAEILTAIRALASAGAPPA